MTILAAFSELMKVQLSLCNSEALPKTFSGVFLAMLDKELVALQYAKNQLSSDSCLKHTLCAKLDGYKIHILATADTLEQAEEMLFDRCLQVLEFWEKDEPCAQRIKHELSTT